jgi:ABC-type Fe3+ transport system permease subunit
MFQYYPVVGRGWLWQNTANGYPFKTGHLNQGGKAMKKIISLALVFSMVLVPAAFAASPWLDGQNYGEKTGGKLSYGLTNTLLGWTKIFSTPNDYSVAGKNVWQGVGQGLIDASVTTVLGAIHLVTFPIPADIDIPSPVDLSGGK